MARRDSFSNVSCFPSFFSLCNYIGPSCSVDVACCLEYMREWRGEVVGHIRTRMWKIVEICTYVHDCIRAANELNTYSRNDCSIR